MQENKKKRIFEQMKGKLSRKKRQKKQLVQTTITLKTKYLMKEVKELCDGNKVIALLALVSAVVTALSTGLGAKEKLFTNTVQSTSSSGETGIGVIQMALEDQILWVFLIILCVALVLLNIYSFYRKVKTSDPIAFVNRIVKEQYDMEEHTAIIIIKAMFENTPKLLVSKSESWNSYFLPYCHYDSNLSEDEIKQKIKIPIAEQLEIDAGDFELCNDFTENTHVVIKKNQSHNSMSKINYRFYYLTFNNPYLGRRFSNGNLHHFYWKSKYELAKDTNTQLNNGDVIAIIDEMSLINQSKLAFQERICSSYEITSQYNIIWNITNECYFNCPICATNSGRDCKCDASYKVKERILMNLATINGYINQLDISGGDPLKNETDRKIIKKANQIFAFSDVRVTTTGKALERLPIGQVVDVVKKCDITYDIPYEVCKDELKAYREYNYNYYNYKQLEKISNSGVKIEMNIHIPILPKMMQKELLSMILEDLRKINPVEVKFIRLMPVGRMGKVDDDYSPEDFLKIVNGLMKENEYYKFNITYNCSLGTNIINFNDNSKTLRTCGMLKRKLGIDCEGKVYACIWGAYIHGYDETNYKDNPFYLGDLKEQTMYDILTSSQTQKLLKQFENLKDGCRVCAFAKRMDGIENVPTRDEAIKQMLDADDPMKKFMEVIITKKSRE